MKKPAEVRAEKIPLSRDVETLVCLRLLGQKPEALDAVTSDTVSV
jgi:hypothetical protein